METWKEFEKTEITHSIAHHLMAVNDLLKQQGYSRVTDVAKYLNITKGSASITLKNLKERGYIEEDLNKFVHLTEIGRQIVSVVIAKRDIIIKFLTEVLDVEEEQAKVDACKIEHLISSHTGERLLHLVQFILSGDRKAAEFIKALRKFHPVAGGVENCNLCIDECQFTEICEVCTPEHN